MGGVQLSAKVFVWTATLLSTLISFGGGLVMYLEGLNVVEFTVKEISAAELTSTGRALNQTFTTAYVVAQEFANKFGVGNLRYVHPERRNYADLRDMMERDAFALLASVRTEVHAISLTIVPMTNTSGNSSGFYSTTALQPSPSPEIKNWQAAHYLPARWGKRSCVHGREHDLSRYHCAASYRLDPETGQRTSLRAEYPIPVLRLYGSEGPPEVAAAQRNWETEGAAFWRRQDVWKAIDGTPYRYAVFATVLPQQLAYHPYVPGPGYKVVIGISINFESWSALLRATEAEATLLATFLDDGLDSQPLAINTGERLIHPGCELLPERAVASGIAPCIRTLRTLPATIQEACRKANSTEAGRFFRTSIAGADNWVRRLVVHQARPHDAMRSIHLVWVRPVSSLEEQINYSLYIFLAFLAVIVMVDVVILVVEVRYIVHPLEKLEWAMEPIDRMEIANAWRRLSESGIGNAFFRLREVHRLLTRFRATLEALTTYKAFLPQSCLPVEEEEEVEEDEQEGPVLTAAPPPQSAPRPETLKRHSRSPARASASARRSPSAPSGAWDKSEVRCPPGATSGIRRVGSMHDVQDRAWSPQSMGEASGHSSGGSSGPPHLQVLSQDMLGAQTSSPRQRTVTVLAVNSRSFLPSLLAGVGGDPAAAIAQQVGRVACQVRLERGNVDLISGDHSFASFDAVRRCPGHRMHAVRCAWALRSRDGVDTLQSTSAVCTGPVLCGDFGTNEMKRFMFVGGLQCLLTGLDRIAAQRGITVLIDERVYMDIEPTCPCKMVDRLLFPKAQSGPFGIWSVVAIPEPKDDGRGGLEWMYEIRHGDNPYAQYNTLLAKILDGSHSAAADELAKTLDAGKAPDGEPEVRAALQELMERLPTLPPGKPAVRLVHEVYLETIERDD